jgi:SulP family sulfate permease
VSAAVLLLLFVVLGASFIEIIPLAALIGVMFMVVIGTFEWSSLRLYKKIPASDIIVVVAVSLITVFADLAIAVIIGILMSALVFAWEHGKSMHAKKTLEHDKTVYRLDGPLFFASVTSFKDIFDFNNDEEHVVIDFKDSRIWDHSGIEALQNITDRYQQNGKYLHLLNLSQDCRQLLHRAEGIVELSFVEGLEWHIADNELD